MEKNLWLEQEERSVTSQLASNKKNSKIDGYLFKRCLIILLVPAMLLMQAYAGACAYIECPYCEEVLEIVSEQVRWFPDVWTCSKCGYDNYEGISTCAVCGTRK